jgi:hypothetical protein
MIEQLTKAAVAYVAAACAYDHNETDENSMALMEAHGELARLLGIDQNEHLEPVLNCDGKCTGFSHNGLAFIVEEQGGGR